MIETVAIVGVGLIGGSFGLALKKAGFSGRILGVSSQATLREALDRGVVDEGLAFREAVSRADLIYLAQPIGEILDALHHIDEVARPEALITDAGSTKSAIVRQARRSVHRCQFLGGHPLAGKEKRGVAEADADLFFGRTYVLTPADAAEVETPLARAFVGWLRAIGATPKLLDPEEHDRIVSYTSHLPQLTSTALGAVIAEHVLSADQLDVAGPALIDATRLAMSPYDVWRDILATNTDVIYQALTAYISELEHLRENLRTREMEKEFVTAGELARRLRRHLS